MYKCKHCQDQTCVVALCLGICWYSESSYIKYNIWPSSDSYHLLLFVFNNSSITTSCQGIRKLALLISFIQKRIFFGWPPQNLGSKAIIFTITVSSTEIIFFGLWVFLILEILVLKWSIGIKTACIAYQHQQKCLPIALALSFIACSTIAYQSSRLRSFSSN